ncbi:MAG: enoyl-CoA hydratase/isomerase family protein [Acidimicrobiales bacterium]
MVLLIDDDQRVRTVRINRPAALNAMDNATFAAIRDALAAAEQDPAVAVVVLTGTGRAFCAGQDLTEMLATRGEDAEPHQFPSMIEMVTSFRKPLIAAVNGLGVGIGMTILAHCDLVLMASTARLRTPFPQLGLAPEAAPAGPSPVESAGSAASILLSGRWFDAEECLRMGFVWKVCRTRRARARDHGGGPGVGGPAPSVVDRHPELMLAAGRRRRSPPTGGSCWPMTTSSAPPPTGRRSPPSSTSGTDFSSIPGL